MTLSAPSFRASIGGTVLGFSPQGFLQLSVVLCWSQLSRLHWWYSAGLFPTGVFAIFSGSLLVQSEGLCLSPFLKRVPGDPLILYRPRGFGTCVMLFVASFFSF